MQQKIEGGVIFVRATKEESAVIKGWRMMRFDKEKGWWYGDVSKQLLGNLKRNGGLIPPAMEALERMNGIQAAVDAERVKPDEDVEPMYDFPVKATLFKHQVRAANMAGMIFGLVDPPGDGT